MGQAKRAANSRLIFPGEGLTPRGGGTVRREAAEEVGREDEEDLKEEALTSGRYT